MKRSELIQIEDRDTFLSLLNKAKISDAEKTKLIQARWDNLYKKYRPERFER